MKCDKWHVTRLRNAPAFVRLRRGRSARRASDKRELRRGSVVAFTLIELLVVISIMGIIAALAVPAVKNLGKSNVQASAARQMLDDVGRARQLAISDHTTVYMIFVPTNFWMLSVPPNSAFANAWWSGPNGLTTAQQTVASNLCDKQLTGYTFVSLRSVGDQPGQGRAHYLAPWQSLPDGTFIAQQKFQQNPQVPYYIRGNNNVVYPVYGFNVTNNIPFPTEDSPTGALLYGNIRGRPPTFGIPFIAFNYLGQLTIDGQSMVANDEYIPLSEGAVLPAIDAPTKKPLMGVGNWPGVSEVPAGNSTNSMYRIVHIDRLTGRATLEYQHVQ